MFYPVELLAGMRADVLADAYYQDAEQDWIIYLSNQIIDPYYNWYLDEADFQSYVSDKYGDADVPKEKIKYYRNNWASDNSPEITPSFYDNTLAFDQKQYYGPVFGSGARIVSYTRKPLDWTTNTNKIYLYSVTYNSGAAFTEGEIIDIKSGGDIHFPDDGSASVVTSNTTGLIVQHISGNSLANSTWTKTLVGRESNTVATTNLNIVLQENITNTTAVFWDSVSFYDWERERNEARKHVFLLNPAAVTDTSNEIRAKLQE